MRLPGFLLIINSQSYLSITISNTFLSAISIFSCYNPLAISNMRFLSLFQLMLESCSVCAFFPKNIQMLQQIFWLLLNTSIVPLIPCLSFHFYCIAHLIIPPPCFFVPWTPTLCSSTYFICSFKKYNFDICPNALHFCGNLLTFH